MNLKLTMILNSIEALKALTEQPLKAKIAFRLASLTATLDSHLEVFQKSRQDVIDKYKIEDTDDEGNTKLVIPAENIEEYSKEITDLMEEEVDVEFKTISLDEIEDIKIEAKFMSVLGWLITEE